MFVRAVLKDRAKAVLARHYWKLLPLSILLVIIQGQLVSIQTTFDGYGYPMFQLQILNRIIPIPNVTPTFLMLVAFGGIAFIVFGIFVSNVLQYGILNGFRAASEDKLEDHDILCGFRMRYWHVVEVQFRKNISIFFWSLLFIIPGIIKAYEYCMVEYIMYDHFDWSTEEVLAASRAMTMGKKGDIFVLDLSFFPWYLLFGIMDIISFGLASLFLNPYILQTAAELYLEIRPEEEKNTSDESDVYEF